MTADSSDEYDGDAEYLQLITNIDLNLRIADPVNTSPLPPPPRTPSPPSEYCPPPHTPSSTPSSRRPAQPHTLPVARLRTYGSTDLPHLYHYGSSTTEGVTREWSTAGTASQGVRGGHVNVIQPGRQRKPTTKKAAFVIFAGTDHGVFTTWAETEPLVCGVPCCIFRGYATVSDAHAAYEYAAARSWVRRCDGSTPQPILTIPQPAHSVDVFDRTNPLNGSDVHDDTWYIVYQGITPECQLNTLGISGALHESVIGLNKAIAKFTGAQDRNGQYRNLKWAQETIVGINTHERLEDTARMDLRRMANNIRALHSEVDGLYLLPAGVWVAHERVAECGAATKRLDESPERCGGVDWMVVWGVSVLVIQVLRL
ncbi:hypothetical protein C8R43DRAFT_951973 [Mycena crocata]|nr:hypothetical protein C8R43DRAFT_951973 [Mycena crocata]